MTLLSLVQLYSGGLAIYINFEFWSAGTSTGLWLKSYRVVAENHKLSWHFPFFVFSRRSLKHLRQSLC